MSRPPKARPRSSTAGPFGNIAHGTSSIIAQQIGLRLADYVVNECGFAADLGAEKYIDIVMRSLRRQSLRRRPRHHRAEPAQPGRRRSRPGLPQPRPPRPNLQRFGLPTLVAINRFPHDTRRRTRPGRAFCGTLGVPSALTEPFTKGGEGSEALARAVVDLIDRNPGVTAHPIYALSDSYEEKLEKVATQIYGADGVTLSDTARSKLHQFVEWGYDGLPICVAKTQYSFSDDPKKLGAPAGWTLHITDVSLSAGAGFLVPIAGNMMLMPGLPKVSRAEEIDVDEDGEILGV